MTEIKIASNAEQLAQRAAQYLVELAGRAITERDRFSLALSGGSTPYALYQLLAHPPYVDQVEWSKVHIFWGDERCVPPEDADSSYRAARESLLDSAPIPESQIYRIKGEINPAEAASEYEQIIVSFFGGEPRFDLILLGMGDDGHTASLFPGTKALDENQRWVIENYVEVKNMWRVTLTPKAINNAANIAFLVSGVGKAERLRQVIRGSYQPHILPSQLVKPVKGKLIWLVDQAAAAQLPQ
jgi:6-phosphogluconolactonase